MSWNSRLRSTDADKNLYIDINTISKADKKVINGTMLLILIL